MRGSCGSKGLFGKPLPCPFDGPAYEVRRHSVLTAPPVADDVPSQMMRLDPF